MNNVQNVIDDVFKKSNGKNVPGAKWLSRECGVGIKESEEEIRKYLSGLTMQDNNEKPITKTILENETETPIKEKRKYVRKEENKLQSVGAIKIIFGIIGLALIGRDFSYQYHFFISIGDWIGGLIGSIVLTSLLLFTPPVIVYCKKATRFILIIFYIPVLLICSFITVQNVTSGFYDTYRVDNTKTITEDNDADKTTYRNERAKDITIRDSYKPNTYYYQLYNNIIKDLNSKIDSLRSDNSKRLSVNQKVDWSNNIDDIFKWTHGTMIFILAIVLAIVLSLSSPVSSLIWFFLKE
jgi:hypothetical protein